MAGPKQPNFTSNSPEASQLAAEQGKNIKDKVETAKKSLDELLSEFKALSDENRQKFNTLEADINGKLAELGKQGFDEEADIAQAEILIGDTQDLITRYQTEGRFIRLQEQYSGLDGVKFLDRDYIKADGREQLWEETILKYAQEGKLTDEVLKNLEAVRAEMGFTDAAEFQKFLEETLAGSEVCAAVDLRRQGDAAKSKSSKFGQLVGRLGLNLTTAAAINTGVTLALGATTAGVGLLVGAAAVGGVRVATRLGENYLNNRRFKKELKTDLEDETSGGHANALGLSKENFYDQIRARQLERFRKETEEDKEDDWEDIRKRYIKGKIKDREELRAALEKKIAGMGREEGEESQVAAALQTLYMTEAGLKLERSVAEQAEAAQAKTGGKAPKTKMFGWGILQSAGARLVYLVPGLRELTSATGGAKLGGQVFEIAAGQSKIFRRDGELTLAGKAAKSVLAGVGAAGLGYLTYHNFDTDAFAEKIEAAYHQEEGSVLGTFTAEVGSNVNKTFGLDSDEPEGPVVINIPEGAVLPGGQGTEGATSATPDNPTAKSIFDESSEAPPVPVPTAEGHVPPAAPESRAAAGNFLEKIGFKQEGGKLNFDMDKAAAHNPNLGKLEQVFDRVAAAKYLEEFGQDKTLDATEASKILNMSANLSKLAETGGDFNPVPGAGALFKEAVSYDPEAHTITITDQAKFETLLDKLKEHTDDLAKSGHLGGAEEYIDNIRNHTWQEIVQSQETHINVPEFPDTPPAHDAVGGAEHHAGVGGHHEAADALAGAHVGAARAEGADIEAQLNPSSPDYDDAPVINLLERAHDPALTLEQKGAAQAIANFQGKVDAGVDLKTAHKSGLEYLLAHGHDNADLLKYQDYKEAYGSAALEAMDNEARHGLGLLSFGSPNPEKLFTYASAFGQAHNMSETEAHLYAAWLGGEDGVLKRDDFKTLVGAAGEGKDHLDTNAVAKTVERFREVANFHDLPKGGQWQPRLVSIPDEHGGSALKLVNFREIKAGSYVFDINADGQPDVGNDNKVIYLNKDHVTALVTAPHGAAEAPPVVKPQPEAKQPPSAEFVGPTRIMGVKVGEPEMGTKLVEPTVMPQDKVEDLMTSDKTSATSALAHEKSPMAETTDQSAFAEGVFKKGKGLTFEIKHEQEAPLDMKVGDRVKVYILPEEGERVIHPLSGDNLGEEPPIDLGEATVKQITDHGYKVVFDRQPPAIPVEDTGMQLRPMVEAVPPHTAPPAEQAGVEQLSPAELAAAGEKIAQEYLADTAAGQKLAINLADGINSQEELEFLRVTYANTFQAVVKGEPGSKETMAYLEPLVDKYIAQNPELFKQQGITSHANLVPAETLRAAGELAVVEKMMADPDWVKGAKPEFRDKGFDWQQALEAKTWTKDGIEYVVKATPPSKDFSLIDGKLGATQASGDFYEVGRNVMGQEKGSATVWTGVKIFARKL